MMNNFKSINYTEKNVDQNTDQVNTINPQSLVLNVYRELDENPIQNLEIINHIQEQLKQLQELHQRKLFMIKEIEAIRFR